jgi:hypothetical protein
LLHQCNSRESDFDAQWLRDALHLDLEWGGYSD